MRRGNEVTRPRAHLGRHVAA